MQALPAQMLLSEGTLVDATTFLPIELNGRFVQRGQQVSIVELGKRLLRAARDGDTEQVRELMGKGAPFTTDWLGTSPLHFAALNNHLKTCEVLLRAGISRDSRTKVDRTPLHMAAYEGHLSIVEVLLSNGADVDARDMLKMTPLHWAVQNGHSDVVTLLLRHGANPEVLNKFDKSPTDIALEINRIDILQLLQVITKDIIDATETLSVELAEDNELGNDDEGNKQAQYIMQEAEDDDDSKLPESLETVQMDTQQEHTTSIDLTDSMQMLKEHGISFLPADNSSVVASAVENGHSLVLTEVGKQVLNSTKPLMRMPVQKQITKIKGRQVIALTPDQLLAMANSSQTQQTNRIPIIFNGSDKPVKRIVMNKNKIIFSGTPNQIARKPKPADTRTSDIELMSRQLAEARREAEEYKQMLKRKEAEAERYKRQLQSIAQAK